jgi:putative membrane-bound dehydrogenase-like protein
MIETWLKLIFSCSFSAYENQPTCILPLGLVFPFGFIPHIMKFLFLFLFCVPMIHAAEPLRVFIRSGEKTHQPGCHDYPAFLADWTKLLTERGAKVRGGNDFPSKEQLGETDVVILHAAEAGNITGEDRVNFEAYLKRGGGVVAIHGGAVSRDPDWYKTVIGGSWNFDHTKYLEGKMSLYFTDLENPITQGLSNFDLDDEIYYDMDLLPEVKILAAAYTPKPKDGISKRGQAVNVYDIQPQIWTYETGNRRAFVCVPGHRYANFSHKSIESLLLRGIAWAGKMKPTDAWPSEEKGLEQALRYPVGGPTKPEEAVSKIEVHPDFEISLVAAEPLINKVLNVDWDEKGRMWVVESPEYPNGLRKVNTEKWKDSGSVKPGIYDRDPLDRISILSDTNGDGVMDKKQVFADKLELATSFVLHKNGVIVSAAPDIWFFEDTDGDEVADKRTKLYTGLGTKDTHAVINNLRWGMDGWVYATHGYSVGEVTPLGVEGKPKVKVGSGVVRFKPDGSEIEMYSSKNANTWGLCMTSDGQCFWTQPTSGTVLFHTVLPEYILAKGKLPKTESFKGMVTGQKTFPLIPREEAPYRQIDYVGSYTAASGCAIYEGGAWPEKWNYSYFVGEPTINIVSHYFVKKDGVTYTAEKEKSREENEFMRSKDLWFRPVENRVGPDGALYVVDFYNQAVIHNDTRGPQHGPANAAVRPDRDHYFGRIWKVQHKDAKKFQVAKIDKKNTASLAKASQDPNAHTRMTAHRLMLELGEAAKVETGSMVERAYREIGDLRDVKNRQALISRFSKSQDNWTKSSLVSAASGSALEVIKDCLSATHTEGLNLLVEQLVPIALRSSDKNSISVLLKNAAAATGAADSLKVSLLQSIIAANPAKPEMSKDVVDALRTLLTDSATDSFVLPLIAAWDQEGALKEAIANKIDELSKVLSDPKAEIGKRIDSARSLIAMKTDHAVSKALEILKSAEENQSLQDAIVAGLSQANFSIHLAEHYPLLNPKIRAAAFESILKRPDATNLLLKKLEDQSVDPKLIGPGDVARLRKHPDTGVAKKADEVFNKLASGAKSKADIMAALLPEVGKPGKADNGKVMFTAACAVCHKIGDLGQSDVGPALTGMGTHAASEILTHIVDPNAEVDPSYWQWNITTKSGETLAGVITRENPASLTLRNQAGDREIRKEEITKRENTQRSLMPEGLDALGAENLRDIIAFMASGMSELAPNSTAATGLRFREPKAEGAIRVLIVGAGSSHHFPRDFIQADSVTLSSIPKTDVVGTLNLQESLALLPKADVLVFSGDHEQWGTKEFQKALNDFADAGKGIVLLHAATWSHPWEGYNKRFVGGETKAHGKGDVVANRINKDKQAILEGVPDTFTISDESYHFRFFENGKQTVLIENAPDGKSKTTHPALWIVNDPKARIVAYTHGHDDKSHAHPVYQTILKNAVNWVSKR